MRRTTGATARTGATRTWKPTSAGSIVRWTDGSGLDAATAAALADVDATVVAGEGAAAGAQHAITGVAVALGQHGIGDSRSHGGE